MTLIGLEIHAQLATASKIFSGASKGYQISQYELPIVHGGHVDVQLPDGSTRHVNIVRAHLEEDAGKSLSTSTAAARRCIEIVGEPDIPSPEAAREFLQQLAQPGDRPRM
jgi:aspartyl-tRNA(Asn)/glutamyl-tRNA(Gln) amidotransferase subunit B